MTYARDMPSTIPCRQRQSLVPQWPKLVWFPSLSSHASCWKRSPRPTEQHKNNPLDQARVGLWSGSVMSQTASVQNSLRIYLLLRTVSHLESYTFPITWIYSSCLTTRTVGCKTRPAQPQHSPFLGPVSAPHHGCHELWSQLFTSTSPSLSVTLLHISS